MADLDHERQQARKALEAALRPKFEEHFGEFPFALNFLRSPDDPFKAAFPGQYLDYKTELAFRAFCAGHQLATS